MWLNKIKRNIERVREQKSEMVNIHNIFSDQRAYQLHRLSSFCLKYYSFVVVVVVVVALMKLILLTLNTSIKPSISLSFSFFFNNCYECETSLASLFTRARSSYACCQIIYNYIFILHDSHSYHFSCKFEMKLTSQCKLFVR